MLSRYGWLSTIILALMLVSGPIQASPKCFTPWTVEFAVSTDGRFVVYSSGDRTSGVCHLGPIVDTRTNQPVLGLGGADSCRFEALEKVFDEALEEASSAHQAAMAGVEFVSLDDLHRYGPFDLNEKGVFRTSPKGARLMVENIGGVRAAADKIHIPASAQAKTDKIEDSERVLELDGRARRLAAANDAPMTANLYVGDDFYLMIFVRINPDRECGEVESKPVHVQRWAE